MTPPGDENSTATPAPGEQIEELAEVTRSAQAAAAEAEAAAAGAKRSAQEAERAAEEADDSADEAEESETEAEEAADEAEGAAGKAAASADKAVDASGKAVDASGKAVDASGKAVDAAGEADKSADEADRSADEADRAADQVEAAVAHDKAATAADDNMAGELLIEERHPDVGMGLPGPPLRRSNPFMFGFFAALGVLVAWGLWNALGQARSVLILLLVSMFIAVGLNPLVEWFMRRGLKRGLSVGVVFLLMIMAVAGVGFAIVPVVTDQINSLIKNAPDYLDLLTKSRTLNELNDRYQFIQKAQDYIQDPALAQRAFGGILGVGRVVANALFSAFTILILTLYFLASLPSVKRAAYSLVPASRRPRVAILGDEVLSRVGGYVSGQFVVAACAGFFMFVFLQIVGLREYALALAIVVMFTAFIPMVGGLIGVVIVALIGFTTGLWTGVACLAYGIVYQQIENYVIAPRIMRRAVDIPGAVTVIAALLGGALLGVVGALLAIPTAAALLLIIREVWVRKADAS
ncbi:AI-2E family transporter [Kribbella sp. NPDC049174]|uniref:AI-2E family transporter n=1 Tax=Kribbella sp. NPDC049174 TaxID=3364112 RepID=UPI00371B9758